MYILTVTTAQKESIGIHASVLLFYQCFLKPSVGKKKKKKDYLEIGFMSRFWLRPYGMSADTAFPMSLKAPLSRQLSEHSLCAKIPELTSGVQFRYIGTVSRMSV